MNNPISILLVFTSFIFSSNFCIANESKVDDEHPFTYTPGPKGPKNWGRLNSTWTICNDGKSQSPVNIDTSTVEVLHNTGELKKTYQAAPSEITNRGHDIMVKWKEFAGTLDIDGTYYNLSQCHWHSPSEHTVNGKKFEMEVHIVHMNAQNQIAVIGVLFNLGLPDPFLAKLMPHLETLDKKGIDLGVVHPEELIFDSKKYYRYSGSLTTPPCSECVTWNIIHEVRTVSKEQIRALKNAVNDGFEENARPTQPLEGRPVQLHLI